VIKKDSFFACKYTRTLYRTCAAFEMGLDAVALCCLVVNTEDAIRYKRPVDFWNSQIQEYLGFKKWDRLDRARKAAVAAGWLVYIQHGKRKAGTYSTSVPSHSECVFGQLNGELLYTSDGYNEGYKVGYNEGYNEGVKQGHNEGEPPSLLPKPDAGPIPNLDATTSATFKFFLNKGCYIDKKDPEEVEWFVDCFKGFSESFLVICINACKTQRERQGLKPRPCRSDLTLMMEKQAPKQSGGIYREPKQETENG